MAVGAGVAGVLGFFGIPLEEQLLFSLALCVVSATTARQLHRIEGQRPGESPGGAAA